MASGISQNCKPKRPFEQAAALGHRLSFAEPRTFIEVVIHSEPEFAAAGAALSRQKSLQSCSPREWSFTLLDGEHAKKRFVQRMFRTSLPIRGGPALLAVKDEPSFSFDAGGSGNSGPLSVQDLRP